MYNISAMKQKLRAQKLLERLNHHPEEKIAKDKQITKQLKSSFLYKNAKKILFYLPIHSEVDLVELYNRTKSKKFALPKIASTTKLHIHYIKDLSETEAGKFNIIEPKGHLKEAKPEDLDLVLVPGIVFARDGHRIGYGKGYYDRLLKKVKCPKIGIAYEFQIVENIPGEPHDTPMDYLATEKGIIKI